MIKVKQCCHSPSQTPKFEATAGDQLLVNHGNGIVKVEIKSVSSPDTLEATLPSGEAIQIERTQVVAIFLED
jgi:hypothetical protein